MPSNPLQLSTDLLGGALGRLHLVWPRSSLHAAVLVQERVVSRKEEAFRIYMRFMGRSGKIGSRLKNTERQDSE